MGRILKTVVQGLTTGIGTELPRNAMSLGSEHGIVALLSLLQVKEIDRPSQGLEFSSIWLIQTAAYTTWCMSI